MRYDAMLKAHRTRAHEPLAFQLCEFPIAFVSIVVVCLFLCVRSSRSTDSRLLFSQIAFTSMYPFLSLLYRPSVLYHVFNIYKICLHCVWCSIIFIVIIFIFCVRACACTVMAATWWWLRATSRIMCLSNWHRSSLAPYRMPPFGWDSCRSMTFRPTR